MTTLTLLVCISNLCETAKKVKDMKKCPFCKDCFLERKTIKETYKYKGHTLEVEQPGEWCNVCEEGILNGADLKATEKMKNDFQSQVDGLLTSE
jgi:HTH-type transcriptional regulator/antitoxin MqsA